MKIQKQHHEKGRPMLKINKIDAKGNTRICRKTRAMDESNENGNFQFIRDFSRTGKLLWQQNDIV